ncbi:MAG: hypothetical protein KGL04_00335 [Elusimicrobia bacterium]|nr:hypothetical protein [Elusimicrobiota bacterium]MDE2312605.1 hypothetical protein [Elusimicrobiota bacterium]
MMRTAALTCALLAAFSGAARAQQGSSATAAAASGSSASAPKTAARPARAPRHPPDVWPRTSRLRVYVHRASVRWAPVSLRPDFGAVPSRTELIAQVRLVRTRKGRIRRGRVLAARASARWLPYKGDHALVVSIYPAAWRKSLKHLEVRYLVSAGFIEGVWAELVQVQGGGPRDWGLDAFTLDRRGVNFSEEYAGRGKILLYALDPRPGRESLNAARGRGFDFGDPDIGRVDFSYRVRGVKPAFP